MIRYLETLLSAMRPAFSRSATFGWFIVVFAGFVARNDSYGVTSIVRALALAPIHYPSLLHFFHSTAWSAESLRACWHRWLVSKKAAHMIAGRIVMLGDHTKTPKDGRRMPAVVTLHEDSETAGKPSFFRGHHWGCLGLLVKAGKRCFAAPLWAEIHHEDLEESRSTRIVVVAGRIARAMGTPAYLVLDAFFSVGPVFLEAARFAGNLHILTRAKKNIVAYLAPVEPEKSRRGRKRKYGEKLKLAELFEKWPRKFETVTSQVYGKEETAKVLTLDLIWKPTKGALRFFLIETLRGRIILMTSDLTMTPTTALALYCHRVTIETLFDSLKNILGAMGYHFWSQYLQPSSRRPSRGKTTTAKSMNPRKTQNTFEAIEKFLHIHMIVIGALQLLARDHPIEIHASARCWLRTPCGVNPSEFVTRTAVANTIRANLCGFAQNMITRLIRDKQIPPENNEHFQDVA
jgi:DDE superfamily endonuclease